MKKSFADILNSLESTRGRKLASKLPSWADAGCSVPTGLSLEQCSSELTGAYKAHLIESYDAGSVYGTAEHPASYTSSRPEPSASYTSSTPEPSASYTSSTPEPNGSTTATGRPVLCDLTGGLGVDSWSFSRVCGTVHYFERDADLVSAASANFALLGASNINVNCATVDAGTELPHCDWIFLDPARRASDGSGKKVFLLEDCTPDVLTLLPVLWSRTSRIMLKLSPMADITMVARRLAERCSGTSGHSCLKEVHVVGLGGEVKELLCVLDSSWNGGYSIVAVPDCSAADTLRFSPEEEADAAPSYADPDAVTGLLLEPDPSSTSHLLLEPDATLLKAGAFKLPCSRFGLKKLDRSTHLYIGDNGKQPGGYPERLFKVHKILETRPFDKRSIAELGARYPAADVTARNLPLSSDELRARLASASKAGARKTATAPSSANTSIHIFGLTCASTRLLLATASFSHSAKVEP